MSHGDYTIYPILDELPENLEDKIILDLGSGFGEIAYRIMAYDGMPWVKYKGKPKFIGVDINDNCLKFSYKFGVYDEVIKRDIEKDGLKGLPKAHILICTEFLEHTKLDEDILEAFKKIAPIIIISVPYGFTENVVYGINEFNHKSSWIPHTFTKHGYKVKIYRKRGSFGRILDLIMDLYYRIRGRNPYALKGIVATYGK